jgi:hypothetical protein
MPKTLKMSRKTIVSLFYFFITYPMLIWVVWLSSERPKEFAYSFLVGLAGMAVGHILGFFASPYNQGEKTAFSEYGKAVAAFMTGFLLSKLDKLLGIVADPDTLGSHPIYGARALIFIIAMATATITTYVFRTHWEDTQDFRNRAQENADS